MSLPDGDGNFVNGRFPSPNMGRSIYLVRYGSVPHHFDHDQYLLLRDLSVCDSYYINCSFYIPNSRFCDFALCNVHDNFIISFKKMGLYCSDYIGRGAGIRRSSNDIYSGVNVIFDQMYDLDIYDGADLKLTFYVKLNFISSISPSLNFNWIFSIRRIAGGFKYLFNGIDTGFSGITRHIPACDVIRGLKYV